MFLMIDGFLLIDYRCALGAGATLLSGARTFIVSGLSNTADASTSVVTGSVVDSTVSLHELLGVLQQQSPAAVSIEQHHKQAAAAAASATAVPLSHEAALTRALDQLNATADNDELTASNTATTAASAAHSDTSETRDWRLPRPMQVWYRQQNASDYRSISIVLSKTAITAHASGLLHVVSYFLDPVNEIRNESKIVHPERWAIEQPRNMDLEVLYSGDVRLPESALMHDDSSSRHSASGDKGSNSASGTINTISNCCFDCTCVVEMN
jgi:hypothetical protein